MRGHAHSVHDTYVLITHTISHTTVHSLQQAIMNSQDPPPPHELAFGIEQSEEDIASNDRSGADGSRAPLAAGTGGVAAATAGGSTTNVELVVRGVGKDRPHSFDGSAGTNDGDAATTGDDPNMPNDDINGGSDPSRLHTSSAINSHEDQWTGPALAKAAAHRFEQRRGCRGCREWWQSSAGGKSGVFSIVLAVIIMLYAAIIVAMPFVADMLTDEGTAERYFNITMSVNLVVGSLCVLLIFFGAWTIRRATCARKSTLQDIAKTTEARRHSKWIAIRMFELVKEEKGPNSPYVYVLLTDKEILTMHASISHPPPSPLTAHYTYSRSVVPLHSLSPTPHLPRLSPSPPLFSSPYLPRPLGPSGTGPTSC